MTEAQEKEFQEILSGLKAHGDMFKELSELSKAEGGFAAIKKLPELFKKQSEDYDSMKKELGKLRKENMSRGQQSVRWVNGTPFVTDECALAITGMYLTCCARQDKWNKQLGDIEETLTKAAGWLGVESRAALTSTDIALPTIYVPQVVELIWKYGQFRANCTVFPLGAGTVKLPQLKAGEDSFTFLGVGTAGMSQSVGEKKVAVTEVTFTANKAGGIVRIPTEIEQDTYIPLGQFLARYISRRFAYLEDTTGFLGDGTGTYANIKGVGPYIATYSNTPQLRQLATGKTKPSDITLTDLRAMRGLVNAAVFGNSPKYYMNPTMDALLATFNTSATVVPYVRRPDGTATLDGFPIVWVGALQAYSTNAAASTYPVFFGDLSYWYLGERGQPRVETSREVYFATDEIGMRALERIDVEAMAPDAMSALQTAAS